MTRERTTIESVLMSSFIEQGKDSIRIVCPICNGGTDKERSLSAIKDDYVIRWKCWRSKCSAGGGHLILRPADKLYKNYIKAEYKRHSKIDEVEYSPLSDLEKLWLLNNWGLTEDQLKDNGVKHLESNQRIFFPFYDYNGRQIGHLERGIKGEKPKALTRWYSENERVHFPVYNRQRAGPILLVEDVPSSIRASKFIKSAALVGAAITDAQAFTLSNVTRDIILALDKDTWSSPNPPIKYKKRYGLYFDSFSLMCLDKDIKNMTDAEINRRFSL